MEPQYDDMLFSMLKECKTLPVFLDNIFGFLQRRTDFYHIAKESNSPIGLPPGLAEQLVKQSFFKWKPKENEKILPESQVPPACQEITVDSLTIKEPKKEPADLTECDIKPVPNNLTESSAKVSKSSAVEFSSSDCYNGAIYDNYSWSQSINDVDITVKISGNVTTRDLAVQILSDAISVKLKNGTVLLEGELCQKCKQNDAIWSLENNKLEIHLDKCREMWWNCLLKSEPKLDVQKMDCTRPFEELPEEAQAKIEELQWNQERKRLGLPTSDQLAMQEKLKKAWNAEGSPFSGPFDPNAVIMQ